MRYNYKLATQPLKQTEYDSPIEQTGYSSQSIVSEKY